MAVEKMRKGRRKYERKRKRYKLCREEMNVTERRAQNCGTAAVNNGFIHRYIAICMKIITTKRCGHILINKFYLNR